MIDRFTFIFAMTILAACAGETSTTQTAVPESPAVAEQAPPSAPAPSPSTSTAASGACGLITEARASEVMGHGMRVAKSTPYECTLHSASGDVTKALSFQVVPGTEAYDRSVSSGEALPGVGERAVVLAQSHMVVAVKGGRTYMGGAFDSSNHTGMREKSVALARAVVGRM